MAFGSRSAAVCEHVEAAIEACFELSYSEPADARGGKFEGERQTVESRADVRDGEHVLVVDREGRVVGCCARGEQANGGKRHHLVRREAGGIAGRRQRTYGYDALSVDAELRTTGCEDRDLSRGEQDARDQRRAGVDHALAVVEDEQCVLGPCRLDDLGEVVEAGAIDRTDVSRHAHRNRVLVRG